jgi:hypothetical protein
MTWTLARRAAKMNPSVQRWLLPSDSIKSKAKPGLRRNLPIIAE